MLEISAKGGVEARFDPCDVFGVEHPLGIDPQVYPILRFEGLQILVGTEAVGRSREAEAIVERATIAVDIERVDVSDPSGVSLEVDLGHEMSTLADHGAELVQGAPGMGEVFEGGMAEHQIEVLTGERTQVEVRKVVVAQRALLIGVQGFDRVEQSGLEFEPFVSVGKIGSDERGQIRVHSAGAGGDQPMGVDGGIACGPRGEAEQSGPEIRPRPDLEDLAILEAPAVGKVVQVVALPVVEDRAVVTQGRLQPRGAAGAGSPITSDPMANGVERKDEHAGSVVEAVAHVRGGQYLDLLIQHPPHSSRSRLERPRMASFRRRGYHAQTMALSPRNTTGQQAAVHDRQIREMFSGIAGVYDRMNGLLSFGFDAGWRRALAAQIDDQAQDLLDACCGTGELILTAKRSGKGQRWVASDFCEPMLRAGVASNGLDREVQILAADTQCLPFEDESFDAVMVGFGLRNLGDLDKGLREISRVLRPGGQLLVLEFFHVERGWMEAPIRFYLSQIVPLLGRLFGQSPDAYRYLPQSMGRFVSPRAFVEALERSGFGSQVLLRPQTAGISHLVVARRQSKVLSSN